MKPKVLLIVAVAVITVLLASFSHAMVPNGVDLIRGAWEGRITVQGTEYQLNLYLNDFGPDPYKPASPEVTVASGGMSITPASKVKRPKATVGPLLARCRDEGNGEFTLSIYGNAIMEGRSFVIRLDGTVTTSGATLNDDQAEGTWRASGAVGTWECRHLDRRSVNLPEFSPQPSLYFNVDVGAARWFWGADQPMTARTSLNINTNIPSARVAVELPTGESVIVNPYTDVFSPEVDFINEFRFWTNDIVGMPVAGGKYVFRALDIAGNPIPGVVGYDTYLGGYEVDPPTNVTTELTDKGILVRWDKVNVIPDSFNPEQKIGFYTVSTESGYDGAPIYTNYHLIPFSRVDFVPNVDRGLALENASNGTYFIGLRSRSVAPAGSGGKSLECHSTDTTEFKFFTVFNGQVSLGFPIQP